jgi:hypothetical protein
MPESLALLWDLFQSRANVLKWNPIVFGCVLYDCIIALASLLWHTSCYFCPGLVLSLSTMIS